MDRKDILQVATDAIKGKVEGNFTTEQTAEALRAALVEVNGGTNKINPKTFFRGNALFDLVQEMLPVMIEEGLKADNPLFKFVEYRNIAAGDENEFCTEGVAEFIVADVAAGIQGVRRQRIGDGMKIPVKTTMKIVRVYENLGRLLAGRITFDQFVDGVSKAFNRQILDDAYKVLDAMSAATPGLDAAYVFSGSFDEDKLLEIIEHVEAATGKVAHILGTRSALRKVNTAVESREGKTDMYNIGYFGKFNGTDMLCLKQAHKPGTSTFILNDSKLLIIAGDDKPIKMVNEGDGLLVETPATNNADLTQEYCYGQAYGTAAICAEKIGIYNIA